MVELCDTKEHMLELAATMMSLTSMRHAHVPRQQGGTKKWLDDVRALIYSAIDDRALPLLLDISRNKENCSWGLPEVSGMISPYNTPHSEYVIFMSKDKHFLLVGVKDVKRQRMADVVTDAMRAKAQGIRTSLDDLTNGFAKVIRERLHDIIKRDVYPAVIAHPFEYSTGSQLEVMPLEGNGQIEWYARTYLRRAYPHLELDVGLDPLTNDVIVSRRKNLLIEEEDARYAVDLENATKEIRRRIDEAIRSCQDVWTITCGEEWFSESKFQISKRDIIFTYMEEAYPDVPFKIGYSRDTWVMIHENGLLPGRSGLYRSD
jgi:hypothetical protein